MNKTSSFLFRILRLFSLSLAIVSATGKSIAETITFDEVAPQAVDDFTIKGVTFDFNVGGVDSADATFNSPGFARQNYTDLQVLEGDANGILTFDFEKLVSTFRFGVNLNSTAVAASPGLTVDLFGKNFNPLGTIPLALSSVGSSFLEGHFIYPGGPPVSRVQIDFTAGSAGVPPRFQIDNLTFIPFTPPVIETPAPPPVAPPPLRRFVPVVPEPYLVVDVEAIASASTSGLAFPSALQGILQSVNQPALRDINGRLFRARSRRSDSDHDTLSRRSLTRYINFASSQNIDYRVALGMRSPQEGEQRVYDTLQLTHPFAMLGATIPFSSSPATSHVAAAPVGEIGTVPTYFSDKTIVGDHRPNRWELFTSVEFGDDDLEDLTTTFTGYQTETYSGTAGIEYQINDWLATGLAFSHLNSQSELSANLGSIDIKGELYTAYITAFKNGFYGDFLFSYGSYDSHLNRNPLFGDNTYADPESRGQTYSLNLGKNFAVTERIITGPILAAEYGRGNIDAFTERGNQRANLIYDHTDFDSFITQLGWQVSHFCEAGNTGIQSQLRLGWEREHLPEDDGVSATLQQSPFLLVTPGEGSERISSFGASGNQASAGTDWLTLGGGVLFDFACDLNFHIDYQGRYFRNNQLTHFYSAKLSYDF